MELVYSFSEKWRNGQLLMESPKYHLEQISRGNQLIGSTIREDSVRQRCIIAW